MNKIVLIEDDATIREIYELILRDEKFEVISAVDGRDGLEKIEEHSPDLVLLDLMMPKMNGDEMIAKLRSKPWGKTVPVIILTNIGRTEVPKNVMDHKVEDIFVKVDLTPDQIIQKVKQTLSS